VFAQDVVDPVDRVNSSGSIIIVNKVNVPKPKTHIPNKNEMLVKKIRSLATIAANNRYHGFDHSVSQINSKINNSWYVDDDMRERAILTIIEEWNINIAKGQKAYEEAIREYNGASKEVQKVISYQMNTLYQEWNTEGMTNPPDGKKIYKKVKENRDKKLRLLKIQAENYRKNHKTTSFNSLGSKK